ncbi:MULTISPECIES: hypothetical protein [Chryseobacterium]|jgi:hypothetical protein|uniref:Uncharacterized protein n=2 Tax=Chryseobacterium TaxID=59732 RepID=A0A101CE96_9FLAO|nr:MULTISPECIES: hypothetical protein [Chryseobacterium]KUJ54634.1 hypothetical protein AR686_17135 [Chryseobacterium aquaticum subsp. greenlandense]MBL7878437.1 hypothetical protein [Chryseobacterium gambrini]QQV01751.1 hypothetical protein I6I61_11705 [Chryseobacterium sp. FDAARGOS 1104]VFB05043.1 Uncharacterised protein [Chryseobacterium taihuense]
MAISERTRKILWAKSGNTCAICRTELIRETDKSSDNIVVGQECHIVSEKSKGPRANPDFEGNYDGHENILLLCANHHIEVDSLTEYYTAGRLKQIKLSHETWVKTTLQKKPDSFSNDKLNIKSLSRIITGKNLLEIINHADVFDFNHDDLNSESEADLIGNFLEELQDYGDIISDLSFSERAKVVLHFDEKINELSRNGFYIFGLRRQVNLFNRVYESLGLFDGASVIIARINHPGIFDNHIIAQFPTVSRFA